MKYDFKKQIRSFGYAWKGLRQCIGKEQNLSFHLITTIIVIGAGILFDITRTEWMIIILCIGMVVAAELTIRQLKDWWIWYHRSVIPLQDK